MNIRAAARTALRRFTGWGYSILLPRSATAGILVNESTALTRSDVYRCTAFISESIAKLPWHVFERRDESRIPQPNNLVDWLLSVQPNPEMGAFKFREFIMTSALLWGNGYAEIVRDASGRPIELWPMQPDRITIFRQDNGALFYRYQTDYDSVELPAADVFHVAGIGFDGISGIPVIRHAQRCIGLGIGMESLGATYFGNGTHPSGILRTDANLTPDQVTQLRESWEAVHQGPERAGKAAIMHGGLQWQPLTVPLDTAQFLESRQFQVTEICRWFGVPPHKIYDLTRSTNNNIEHQSIEVVTDCLMPWATRLEEQANIKLIGRNNRGRIYTKINLHGLLRGDMAAQSAHLREMRQNGIYSANDCRAFLEKNPVPGGDEYLVQSNMIPSKLLAKLVESQIKTNNTPAEPRRTGAEETQNTVAAIANVLRPDIVRVRDLIAATAGTQQPTQICIEAGAIQMHSPPITLHLPDHRMEPGSIQVNTAPINVTIPERETRVHVDGAVINAPNTVNIPERNVTVEPSVVNVTVPEREFRIENPINVTVPERNVTVEPSVVNVTVPEREFRIENPINVTVPEREVHVAAPSIALNVPEREFRLEAPAPVVNIAPTQVTVESPVVHVEPTQVQIDPRFSFELDVSSKRPSLGQTTVEARDERGRIKSVIKKDVITGHAVRMIVERDKAGRMLSTRTEELEEEAALE